MPYQPFRVRIKLCAPLIPTTHIPVLDGVLWGAAYRAWGRPPEPGELPLDQEDGIYRASCMVVPHGLDVMGRQTWVRSIVRDIHQVPVRWVIKPDGEYYGEMGLYQAGRGTFKNALHTYPRLLPPPGDITDGRWDVYFYGVGDIDTIAGLLRVLPGLGRKAARGYGAIDQAPDAIRVEAEPEDGSWIKRGRPMRPLPADLWAQLPGATPDWPTRLAPVRHPYHNAPAEPCVAPDGYCVVEETL